MMRVMSPRRCLLRRGFVAVILALGYYAILLGVGGGLQYLGYRLWRIHDPYAHLFYLVASALGTIIFIFGIPFPVRFEAPGPRLGPEEQPLFFEVVKRVAAKTGEALPEEIYL